jgi:hypothetical protein
MARFGSSKISAFSSFLKVGGAVQSLIFDGMQNNAMDAKRLQES